MSFSRVATSFLFPSRRRSGLVWWKKSHSSLYCLVSPLRGMKGSIFRLSTALHLLGHCTIVKECHHLLEVSTVSSSVFGHSWIYIFYIQSYIYYPFIVDTLSSPLQRSIRFLQDPLPTTSFSFLTDGIPFTYIMGSIGFTKFVTMDLTVLLDTHCTPTVIQIAK
jgi:hypothetical protein